MGNLQYSFSMHQLEKLEEAHRNIMGKYNKILKVNINLVYLTGWYRLKICSNLILNMNTITWIKSYLGFSWKIGKGRYFVLTVDLIQPVGLDSAPLLFGKIIHHLVNYRRKNLLNIACFLDEGPILLELFFQANPSSHFVQKTFQKSAFTVKVKKPIWETQEFMPELGIDFRTKTSLHY